MAKRDLWAYWSKRERDIMFNWTGFTYDDDDNIVRKGGTKRDGRVLHDFFSHVKGSLGTTFIEELEKRGYDITTLKFSISKKENP